MAEDGPPVAEDNPPVAEDNAPVAEGNAPVAEDDPPVAEDDAPLPTIRATSPGWKRSAREGAVGLRLLPWCGKINLRGDPGDAAFVNGAGEALGMPLPPEAHLTSTSADGDGLVFWLGPDEWLVHCNLARTETLLARLTEKLAPLHHAATEVTDYYAVLELTGENAAGILARGCPLDLHERRFKAAQCAQTRFGNASVLLYKPGAESLFHIQVRWSFTEYLWDYLVQVIDTL